MGPAPWAAAAPDGHGSPWLPLLAVAGAAFLLWLLWVAWLEPRWLQVVAFRFRPGSGPSPASPWPRPGAAGAAPGAAQTGPPGRRRQPAGQEPPWPQAREGARPAVGDGRRIRIAHLTDLHAPAYPFAHSFLLQCLVRAEPDLIAFTGDLADGPHQPADGGVQLLADLARRWPVYLVPGNHDHLAGWPALQGRLAAAGVRLLVNQGDTLRIGGAQFFLAGVDDPHTGRDRLDEALQGCPAGLPVILLAHAPSAPLREQAARRRVTLVLAGHTHGGQVRLPGVGALWIPGQGWFPRYDWGWFVIGGTPWYISSGLGTPRPWIRWRCRPEVALIDLELAPPQGP